MDRHENNLSGGPIKTYIYYIILIYIHYIDMLYIYIYGPPRKKPLYRHENFLGGTGGAFICSLYNAPLDKIMYITVNVKYSSIKFLV